MATDVLANNAFTTLGAAVTTTPSAGTSETWTVASTALFPALSAYQQIRLTVGPNSDTSPEIVIGTANLSGTTLTVLRGAEGSTIKTHASGDPIAANLTAGNLYALSSIPPGLHADGTTDDSDTINAYITNLSTGGGGVVYLPPGSYAVGNAGGIVLQTNVHLRGAGTATRLVPLSTCTDAVMTNNEFAWNYGASYLAIDGRSYFSGPDAHGVHCYGDTSGLDGLGGIPALQSQFVGAAQVATLTAALSTSGAITSLPVSFLASAVLAGPVVVGTTGHTQTFTTTGAAATATSIPVTSATPNFAYPIGSTVTAPDSTYGWLGASPLMPPDSPSGWFHHLYIFHTVGHNVYLDQAVRGQLWDNIYALGAGLPSGPGTSSCNLVVNNSTDCMMSNLIMGCGYSASVYMFQPGDYSITNSKFWCPGLYFNPVTGVTTNRTSSQTTGTGILIESLGHVMISNSEVQDCTGVGLWISGSYGNKIDLLTEDCAFADVVIDGASHDNDLDIRGRTEGVFPTGQTAGVIYSGSTITNPNRIKYRRDSNYMTGGVPLYLFQSGANLLMVNGLNLGDRGFAGVLSTTSWAPTDLQLFDTWYYNLTAGQTLTLGDMPAGSVAPGEEICIVVVQAGGCSLSYSPGATFFTTPALPSATGLYSFRFRNMSTTTTPFWVQV